MRDDSFEIKPITENDLEDVLEIYRQNEDFLALGPEPEASMAMILRDIESSRHEHGVFCGVYASGGRMVGVVDYVPGNFNGAPHVAFISLLMIVPSLHNLGIGTKILEIVENRIARITGVSEIQTAVQLNNPAAFRFWQHNKYRVFGKPERRPDQTVVSYLRKNLIPSDWAP